jgi:hypothetical protein
MAGNFDKQDRSYRSATAPTDLEKVVISHYILLWEWGKHTYMYPLRSKCSSGNRHPAKQKRPVMLVAPMPFASMERLVSRRYHRYSALYVESRFLVVVVGTEERR